MEWTEQQIRYVIQDMTSENPLACRALFKIADVEFTGKVPTMAVSLSGNPILKINLDFCRKHLRSENDVKAVLLHEFLHVLLLHTEKYKISNPLLNIALDAIINSIIYRYKGMDYAGFFARFYKWEGISLLLRPELMNCRMMNCRMMNCRNGQISMRKYMRANTVLMISMSFWSTSKTRSTRRKRERSCCLAIIVERIFPRRRKKYWTAF